MQRYICKNCDDLECETSICPICGNRTILLSSEVYYCKECNSPCFNDTCEKCHSKTIKIGSDIRPVFAKERLLLEALEGEPFKYANKSIWCTGGNHYLIDGIKKSFNFVEFRKKDSNTIIKALKENEEENLKYEKKDLDNKFINSFIECNKQHLNEITDEAINYIKNISKDFDISSIFVSFSGGKDSTVTSNLVMRALKNESIMHIYGDTTLEYKESKDYVDEFKKFYPNTPLLIAKNMDQDFNNLCEVVGPPSRVMRWCCTVFKTGAITKKIEQLYKDKKSLLSFQGIRRAESLSRSKYDRDTHSPKIAKQKVAAPLIDWTDFDVWLYILSNKIPFNSAYKEGFSRVGCWCCPNNGDWSSFLSSIYMNEEYVKFKNILYDFAKKVGKPDYKEYVDSGKWKARQGGNGLESGSKTVTFKPCAFDENSVNFELNKPIQEELYTFFKPFGILNKDIGNKRLNEVYILSKNDNNPIMKLSGRIGDNVLKVTFLNIVKPYKSKKEMEMFVKYQITKYQTCIACSYCQSVCKFNALKVLNPNKGNVDNNKIIYNIDSNKCVGCLECVKHFDGGCYIKKVLKTNKGN